MFVFWQTSEQKKKETFFAWSYTRLSGWCQFQTLVKNPSQRERGEERERERDELGKRERERERPGWREKKREKKKM